MQQKRQQNFDSLPEKSEKFLKPEIQKTPQIKAFQVLTSVGNVSKISKSIFNSFEGV